jgi:hypothetical protein
MLTIVFAAATTLLAQAALNGGACLDSPKSVPQGLFGTDPSSAIVRIDKVVSTQSMIDGQIIGYLYTRQDGTTWLGQRAQQYMSAVGSAAVNTVLTSTHMPGAKTTEFPPEKVYGVKTNYSEIFQVKLPPAAFQPLNIRLDPCVAWPAGMALPNPLP